MSNYIGYDSNGKITTLDLWLTFTCWSGGTIHEALRHFKEMPQRDKDRFCTMIIKHMDNGQIKDIESGYASLFMKARLGL